jgi:hypothetical protein
MCIVYVYVHCVCVCALCMCMCIVYVYVHCVCVQSSLGLSLLDKAVCALAKASEVDPSLVPAYYNRALVLLDRMKWTDDAQEASTLLVSAREALKRSVVPPIIVRNLSHCHNTLAQSHIHTCTLAHTRPHSRSLTLTL